MEKSKTQRNGKAHLISVLGGDSDVGAIWAAVVEQNLFTVEAPGIEPVTASLGEDAQCFRGTITIAGRKPIRHLVAISAELAKTRPGADPEGRRTILCDNDPTFVLYRICATVWIAGRAGVGRLVQRGTQPPWSDQAAYRPGMLSGAGQRHQEVVPEMDSKRPAAEAD